MTIQGDIKTIAVIACTKAEYIARIEKDLVPILEKYHGFEFKKIRQGEDVRFQAGVMKIFRVRHPDQLRGLGPYQLVKVGKFYNHPHLEEIEELYSMEVQRRKINAKRT